MLKVNNISKTYGDKKAVDNISLHIEAGDIYAIIGHNGAGKTTLIKMITGLLDPDKNSCTNVVAPNGAGKSTTIRAVVGVLDFTEGDIFIDGHSVKTESLECKKITAYIPDNPDLYENLTGIQYLNFIADVFEISESDREESIKKFADKFEITEALGDLISSYSHGMKQKLAIISALIHNPKLMVMDEPFVGLDPKATFVLKEIMHEMCQNGAAVFFSTHVLDVAEKLCNKVAIIKQGQIIASGTMEELTQGQSLENVFLEAVNE